MAVNKRTSAIKGEEDMKYDWGNFYKKLETDFDETNMTQKIYHSSTEKLNAWVQRLWERYCKGTRKDPVETIKRMSIAVLYNFFHWLLEVRRTRIKSTTTLQTYWNVFVIVRKKLTGYPSIEPLVKSQMTGVRQRLAQEFELRSEPKPKPIMRSEDEFELLKTLWLSTDMRFDHERHRLELAFILQLAGITGNRPGALLSLKYKDIKVALLRDPNGGQQPRPIIETSFGCTKSYLGQKDTNTFPIPDIPKEPCLLLCPQVTFLSLIFLDQAFAAPELSSPEDFFRLRVLKGLNEQRVPFKDSILNVPIFRRSQQTIYGTSISANDPMTYATLHAQIQTLGGVTGIDLPTGAYAFRRGSGEALDNSSHISDAQRNLILQHADDRTFKKNYISHYVTADAQAAFRGLEPQTALIRAASGMSRSIDRRRPTALTSEQQREIDMRPEVVFQSRLIKRLKAERRLKADAYAKEQHREAKAKLGRIKRGLRKESLKQARDLFNKIQPVLDIQQQLQSGSLPDGGASPAQLQYSFKERYQVVDSLLRFVTPTADEECKRRAQAINSIVALGELQEGPSFNRQHESPARPPNQFDKDVEAAAKDQQPTCIPDPLPLRFDTLLGQAAPNATKMKFRTSLTTVLMGRVAATYSDSELKAILRFYDEDYASNSRFELLHRLEDLCDRYGLQSFDRKEALNHRSTHKGLRHLRQKHQAVLRYVQERLTETNPSHTCKICYELIDSTRLPLTLPSPSCKHEAEVCTPCLSRHLATRINQGRAQSADCPTCDCTVDRTLITKLVDKETLAKFDKLLNMASLHSNLNLRQCANPRCLVDQKVEPEHPGSQLMTCSACDQEKCLRCIDTQAPPNREAAANDEAFRHYIDNNSETMVCKSCGRWIEKIAGCDHLTWHKEMAFEKFLQLPFELRATVYEYYSAFEDSHFTFYRHCGELWPPICLASERLCAEFFPYMRLLIAEPSSSSLSTVPHGLFRSSDWQHIRVVRDIENFKILHRLIIMGLPKLSSITVTLPPFVTHGVHGPEDAWLWRALSCLTQDVHLELVGYNDDLGDPVQSARSAVEAFRMPNHRRIWRLYYDLWSFHDMQVAFDFDPSVSNSLINQRTRQRKLDCFQEPTAGVSPLPDCEKYCPSQDKLLHLKDNFTFPYIHPQSFWDKILDMGPTSAQGFLTIALIMAFRNAAQMMNADCRPVWLDTTQMQDLRVAWIKYYSVASQIYVSVPVCYSFPGFTYRRPEFSDFEIGRMLQAESPRVHVARHRLHNVPCSVQIIPLGRHAATVPTILRHNLQLEGFKLNCERSLTLPACARPLSTFSDSRNIYVVYEHLGDSLAAFLARHGRLSEPMASRILGQLLTIPTKMKVMSSPRFLSTQDVFVDAFGCVKVLHAQAYSNARPFSTGLLAYELLVGSQLPYLRIPTLTMRDTAYVNKEHLPFLTDEAIDFILKSLRADRMEEIVCHPWLAYSARDHDPVNFVAQALKVEHGGLEGLTPPHFVQNRVNTSPPLLLKVFGPWPELDVNRIMANLP
ncbi:MAG: hypothetical protein M1814_000897 [Vezdaea aestivalis]|nr:MAG: hypothetical protein M1814_000897 [Vezdaea aestivalis]